MINSQVRGAKAKAAGDEFEEEFDRYHDGLMRAELAEIWQSYPKYRYYGATIGWRPGEKGPFDRWGCLYTGRPVFFELKHREAKDYFTWKAKDEHQLQALRRMVHISQGMALCFVLVDWQWNNVKELRIHWITGIPASRVERETGILVPNRRWFETIDNLNLVEVPDANVQYLSTQNDPEFQRLGKLWREGALF